MSALTLNINHGSLASFPASMLDHPALPNYRKLFVIDPPIARRGGRVLDRHRGISLGRSDDLRN